MGQVAARVWGTKRVEQGRVPLGESGKSQGPPHTPHPSPKPGFPIWAGAACQERPHVCANRGGEVTGAGCRGCKSRKGPRAPPGAAGRLTRGLRGRRPPGPACAFATERPRPGGAASGWKVGAPAGARSPGDKLGYLCLFPDHIVGAEQVSQKQVELLLLRRGRRHCARRERQREKEGGETEAVRRAGGPAGGVGAGPARGPAPAAARDREGRAGKGGAKGKGEDGAGPRDPSPRRGRRRQRLIGPGRAGRGRGRLLWVRYDWPRTLQCRHRWRAASSRAWCGPGGSGTSQPECGRDCVAWVAGGAGWRA